MVSITPYNGGSGIIGGANEYFVERGYVQLVVAVRGTGRRPRAPGPASTSASNATATRSSTGQSHQPWSDVPVALDGASYAAINQLFTAAEHPPARRRLLFPIVPEADVFRGIVFQGGQTNVGFHPGAARVGHRSPLSCCRPPQHVVLIPVYAPLAPPSVTTCSAATPASRCRRSRRVSSAATSRSTVEYWRTPFAHRDHRRGRRADVHHRRPARHLPARRPVAVRGAPQARRPHQVADGRLGSPRRVERRGSAGRRGARNLERSRCSGSTSTSATSTPARRAMPQVTQFPCWATGTSTCSPTGPIPNLVPEIARLPLQPGGGLARPRRACGRRRWRRAPLRVPVQRGVLAPSRPVAHGCSSTAHRVTPDNTLTQVLEFDVHPTEPLAQDLQLTGPDRGADPPARPPRREAVVVARVRPTSHPTARRPS